MTINKDKYWKCVHQHSSTSHPTTHIVITHKHLHTRSYILTPMATHTHSLSLSLSHHDIVLSVCDFDLFSTQETDSGWQCVILTHLFSPQERDSGWQPAEVREAWEGRGAVPGCRVHPSLSHSAGDGPGPALLWHPVLAFHALGWQLCLRPDPCSGEVRNWFLLPSHPLHGQLYRRGEVAKFTALVFVGFYC